VAQRGGDRRSQLLWLGASQQDRQGEGAHTQTDSGDGEVLSEGLGSPYDQGDSRPDGDQLKGDVHC
jgi:hypothetical protein